MSKNNYDIRLMVKCAQMYYDEGLNQGEIAEKLQISKSSISRILSSAKDKNIVKISVVNPIKNQYINLEKQMEKKFKLKEAIIVDSMTNEPEEIKRELARAAAEYLKRVIKDDQIIGVTWGTTLSKIPEYVKNDRRNKVTFIPLVGGVGETNIEIHSNSIALELSKKFKGESRMLYAPSIVDNENRKEIFIHDKNIQAFFELMKKADIALMGIGFPLLNTSTLIESGYFTLDDIEDLERQGATADICSMFIDKYGSGDKFELNKRIIGISLESLKKVPLKIGVAGYIEKKKAILASIVGGYVDVLIVDNKTAEAVLDLSYTF